MSALTNALLMTDQQLEEEGREMYEQMATDPEYRQHQLAETFLLTDQDARFYRSLIEDHIEHRDLIRTFVTWLERLEHFAWLDATAKVNAERRLATEVGSMIGPLGDPDSGHPLNVLAKFYRAEHAKVTKEMESPV